MRVLRDEFFIRKDFAFYDSCIQAVLNVSLISAYELLRRFVYRGDAEDDETLQELRKEGYVVSTVGQTKLAQMLGYSRRQTINEHIATMKKLGWLSVAQDQSSNKAYYVLGQELRDARSGAHEVFFVDAWLAELWTHMEDRCEAEFGKRRVLGTTVQWRIDIAKKYVESILDGPEQLLSCTEKRTGVVRCTGQGLSVVPDTEEENSQVENLEVDKGEGPVASLPSPPLSGAEENSPARSFAGKPKVPRSVDEEPTLSESGEYASVPPPPPAPIPKWMQESPGVAVGDDRVRGPVPKAPSSVHVDAPVSSRPRVPEHLAEIVSQASERGRKVAEAQLQKAKARETKLASLGGKPIPVTRKKQLTTLENSWKELMEARFPGTQIAAWEGKERGQVWNLVEKYTGEIVGEALHYLVEQWDEIRTRMLKGRGGVPSVGFLLRFHDVLVIESQRWTEYRHVKKQVDDWYGGDPYKPNPPQELHLRYLALRKEMADLGLPV